MKTTGILENQEWYSALMEEIKATIDKAVFNSRQELIIGYHEIGKAILEATDNFNREKIYGQEITKHLALSCGKSQRTIEQAVKFAQKYPDLDKLPEGKNISWTKIITKYLPDNREPHICDFQQVQRCRCGKVKFNP